MGEWAEGLARSVKESWKREEEHRRVHDPVALPVRWHQASSGLSDHWDNVRRLVAGSVADPVPLAGRIEQLTEIYKRVPSRRLVVLGPAGAGKTVLACRLVLDLLEERRPGEPVPVIVSAGSWNPRTTSLHDWLTRQLVRDHPSLAARAGPDGQNRAAALIAAGHVIPVLDGFDEMAGGFHEAALRRLNRAPDVPMVVTSRVAEYADAVERVDVLSAAAVVELDDLSLEDLDAYLPRTAAGRRSGLWSAVLDRMRTEPHEPGPAMLREVLANPLMVFLARTIYSDRPGRDPVDLLDTGRYPGVQALQDHLLAEFVPAVYEADSDRRRRWTADRARHYLTHLAGHLRSAGTNDVAWWQLRDTVPRWKRTLVFAAVDGLLIGFAGGVAYPGTLGKAVLGGFALGLLTSLMSVLTVALTAGLAPGPRSGRRRGRTRWLSGKVANALLTGFTTLVSGIAAGLAVGFATAFATGFPDWLTNGLVAGFAVGLPGGLAGGIIGRRKAGPQPTHTRLQIRGRGRSVAGKFIAGLMAGFAVGLPGGFAGAITGRIGVQYRDVFVTGLVNGLVAGTALGLVIGLVAALVFGLEARADTSEVVSAAESLARDRRNALRKILAVGLGLGVAFELSDGWRHLAVFAVTFAAGFVGVRATSAWIHWVVLARGWLPMTGRLPWRVQAFLDDAYHRGVLRRAGAVYQFRHVRLQHHLTAVPATAESPRGAGRP